MRGKTPKYHAKIPKPKYARLPFLRFEFSDETKNIKKKKLFFLNLAIANPQTVSDLRLKHNCTKGMLHQLEKEIRLDSFFFFLTPVLLLCALPPPP